MGTKNYSCAASADDAREQAGTMTLTNANNTIAAATHYLGLSFDTSADPITQGTTITSATLGYDVTTGGAVVSFTWKGEKVVNATQYTTAANNASDRYNNTPTTASVSDAGNPVGAGTRTVDVTAIVQELVNQASWGTGRINLIGKGSAASNVSIRAFDGSVATETLTVVTADGGAFQLFGRLVPFVRGGRVISQGW